MKYKTTEPFPPGHFYSALTDREALKFNEKRIWPEKCSLPLGIEFNENQQIEFLTSIFPEYLSDYRYSATLANNEAADNTTFYEDNGQFGQLDSRALFVMLRYLKPKKIIEVGSGFTSLLTADVNKKFFNNEINFSCIEPYPRNFLKDGVEGINELVISKVEDLDIGYFEELKENDILFIDSSHVSKTGSDVNYLYFEILPRLSPGVVIHIHDIFFPCDYPRNWVIEEGRCWNEQYVLRALLMFSNAFEVLFGSAYSFYRLPELVKELCGQYMGGGSIWIRRR